MYILICLFLLEGRNTILIELKIHIHFYVLGKNGGIIWALRLSLKWISRIMTSIRVTIGKSSMPYES